MFDNLLGSFDKNEITVSILIRYVKPELKTVLQSAIHVNFLTDCKASLICAKQGKTRTNQNEYLWCPQCRCLNFQHSKMNHKWTRTAKSKKEWSNENKQRKWFLKAQSYRCYNG